MLDLRIKALVWAEMVSSGIVPMESNYGQVSAKVALQLEGLSKEDARKLRRRFRKLWRLKRTKAYRNLKPGKPTASMMRRRKDQVTRMFLIRAMDEIKKTDPDYDAFRYGV